MTTIEQLLGGIVMCLLSAGIGSWVGAKGRVPVDLCAERRLSCVKLSNEKLDKMSKDLEELKDDLKAFISKNG